MATEKYPIGIQTFEKLIEEGFTYVDKTSFVARIVNTGGYYFLSRPRRFGKSLLLSTLHAYFEGRRDLFKGLYLDTADVDWTPAPVLHFDFNSEDYTREDGLVSRLNQSLRIMEQEYGIIHTDSTSIPARFENLIRTVHGKTGRKVVVLVDEYDKPLLGIEDNRELFEKNQALLKGFFGNLKSMDRHIRLAFLTGVARFNKVSIFSDLNNLNDISLTDEFAEICGWSGEELTANFPEGISKLASKNGETPESTVEALRRFYDGYLFSRNASRVYNPFSVLLAFRNLEIKPYWFSTGTPTFLVKRVLSRRMALESLNDRVCAEDELIQVNINSPDPVPLMFQTGYLTIASYDTERGRYHLTFPNKEVEIGFAKSLYPLYVADSDSSDRPFSIFKFQDDLYDGEPEKFMERLQALCKAMPYESRNEDNYRNIVWLLYTLCGTEALSERHSHKGRSDLEVRTRDCIYVFEFKYDESVEAAMKQLHERDYAGHYRLDRRRVFLIGANFSSVKADPGLTGWRIEELPR